LATEDVCSEKGCCVVHVLAWRIVSLHFDL
jgi:hypothetical protein